MQRRSGRLGAVLFTDIVDSTSVAAEMGNARWSELVARHHRIVRSQLGRSGGQEIDTAGDGFFVVFERPADAIRCAAASAEAVRELGIQIRAGVSFGELDRSGQKPSGLVVNTAARVMAAAGPGEILVPVSVKEIVSGAGISFAEDGIHRLKGLDGEFRLFKVTEVDGTPVAPSFDPEAAAERRRGIVPTGRGRRRTPLILGVAVGALALVTIAVLLQSGDEPTQGPGPLRNAVARIDVETGQVRAPIFLGDRRIDSHDLTADVDRLMSVGEGGVWLLQPPHLLHVDPLHDNIRSQIFVGAAESQSVFTGLDKVWVLTGELLWEVNPGSDEATVVVRLPARFQLSTTSLAVGDAVWIGTSGGTLIRHDPGTGDELEVDTGTSIDALAATKDDVWLTDVFTSTITRLDAESRDVVGDPIEVQGSIDQIAATEDYVWILDRQLGSLTRIDVETGDQREEPVGDEPTEMAVGRDAVWVGDLGGSLYEVDAEILAITEHPIGAEVLSVDVDDRDEFPWVYVGAPV
jgi:class 3 adenylate cyclase